MNQPIFTELFSNNLAQLPVADATAIELFDQAGAKVAQIENQPGQAGSLRVYLWLAKKFGAITPEAAELGLVIYAEHTGDARRNPGKHPNIDRLFSIQTSGQTLSVKSI